MDKDYILEHLNIFFPQDGYDTENVEEAIESAKLIVDESAIVNILKGVLLDESLIEVQLHDLSKVFFCRVLDNPSEFDEGGDMDSKDFEYVTASYLDYFENVIITPLEPGLGNFFISSLPQDKLKVVLRIVTSKSGIEIGCFFDSKVLIGDMPVLQLTFPIVARKIEGSAEYRAKIPKNMKFNIKVGRIGSKQFFSTTPMAISAEGIELVDPMGKQSNLENDEIVHLELQVPGEETVLVKGHVKDIRKFRNSSGIQYCFSVKFELESHAITSSVEKLVGLVQRKHLRELSDLAEEYGVDYDEW